MTFLKSAIALGLPLLLASPAIAQVGSRPEGVVRVQNNINFFVAGPTGEGEDAVKLREKAQRAVYEMAAHECDLLREILAKDCRMESLNVNVNATNARQYGQQQQEGFTVGGSISLQITLK